QLLQAVVSRVRLGWLVAPNVGLAPAPADASDVGSDYGRMGLSALTSVAISIRDDMLAARSLLLFSSFDNVDRPPRHLRRCRHAQAERRDDFCVGELAGVRRIQHS